ncbi:uncharacterized protein LOC134194222 [Corticium candelabrum]|uniref:uncharacterized protein LOC134194222 n=1 Tax=Corticium candelabrum TaxID=121492 RepID=UPI002E255D5C|nr:uncharacterized protein LOC134194222 [Corticium candelabrum]
MSRDLRLFVVLLTKVTMSTFRRLDEEKSVKFANANPPQDAARLNRPVDHFERERSAILHTAERQKQMYKKSLEHLQGKTKTHSPVPFVRRKTSSEYTQLSNLPAVPLSPLAGGPSHGRGLEQLQERGVNPTRSQGHLSSPSAPFSRYVPNNKLLAGGKPPPTVQRRATADVPYFGMTSVGVAPKLMLSRTPDVNASRRRMQSTMNYNPQEAKLQLSSGQFLMGDGSLRKAASDRDVYRSSLEAEDENNHQPLATLQEMKPGSSQNKRHGVNTSSTDFASLLDLLPSLNSKTPVTSKSDKNGQQDVVEEVEETELPDDYGMSTRLVKAVRDIETRLADHHLQDLEDKAFTSKSSSRPANLQLPNKTRKYQTYMTLPPMIPIPWDLLDANSDTEIEDDKMEANEKSVEKERKRSASFSNDEKKTESDLAKQFEAIKHCRYLRHYKPKVKRESLF